MKMTSILLGTAALVATAGVAVAGPSAVHMGKARHHQLKGVDRASTVLYDQTASDSGIGIVSQNFESTFAQYSAAAADDFTLEASNSTVKEVDADGVYFAPPYGPATSEDVTFYKDKHGKPGKITAQFLGVTGSDSSGDFAISLGSGAKRVKGGHTYWVSVVANCPFETCGEWGWETNLGVFGDPSQWQNPGGGFGIGCTTWSQESVCIPDGQGDHMFTLRGVTHG